MITAAVVLVVLERVRGSWLWRGGAGVCLLKMEGGSVPREVAVFLLAAELRR